MIRVNIHLTEKQIAALKAMAEDKGVGYAELVRRAVDDFLEKKAKAQK